MKIDTELEAIKLQEVFYRPHRTYSAETKAIKAHLEERIEVYKEQLKTSKMDEYEKNRLLDFWRGVYNRHFKNSNG